MPPGAPSKQAISALAIASGLALSLEIASGADWHYTLGEPRENQQANFCAGRQDVDEIAGIFERYGPRTGYAALDGSLNCSIKVKTFTPLEVYDTVTISKGKPGEYVIRFVEVQDDAGERLYLVTTRDVVTE